MLRNGKTGAKLINLEKGSTGKGYDQQKVSLEPRMRERKGMPEGVHEGQEAGGKLWKAFSALPRRWTLYGELLRECMQGKDTT